ANNDTHPRANASSSAQHPSLPPIPSIPSPLTQSRRRSTLTTHSPFQTASVDIEPASLRRRSILARGGTLTTSQLRETAPRVPISPTTTATATTTGPDRSGAAPNKPLKPAPPPSAIKPPPIAPLSLSTSLQSSLTQRRGGGGQQQQQQRQQQQQQQQVITLSDLHRERQAFFDTRVTGRAEIWSVVRSVCEALEAGRVAEAQVLLDASGCTAPTGEVWGKRGGVYDEWGGCYQVPAWCLGVPRGVVVGGDRGQGQGDKEGEVDNDTETLDGRDADGEVEGKDIEGLVGGEEKGKERFEEKDPGKMVRVKVRLSNRNRDVVIEGFGMEQSISVLVGRIREDVDEMDERADVKIFYLGHVVPESESLADHGWREGHV
ncbi:hypothetical protein LTS18_004457, partial [Coniosporium uncinatum]